MNKSFVPLICDSCLNNSKCNSLHPLVSDNKCIIYRPGNPNEVLFASLPDKHKTQTIYPYGYDGEDENY